MTTLPHLDLLSLEDPMASWRDQTSPQAQTDMDGILDAALELATDTLSASDDLAPFAVANTPDGQQQVLSTYPSETAQPAALLSDLQAALRADRGDYVAVAVVSDVTIDGGDAIQVHVEHSEPTPPALVMALPYTRTDSGVTFGTLKAAAGSRRIWS